MGCDAEDEDTIFAYSHTTSGTLKGGVSVYKDTSGGFVYLPDLNIFSLPGQSILYFSLKPIVISMEN
jgi:hypothetical protein